MTDEIISLSNIPSDKLQALILDTNLQSLIELRIIRVQLEILVATIQSSQELKPDYAKYLKGDRNINSSMRDETYVAMIGDIIEKYSK